MYGRRHKLLSDPKFQAQAGTCMDMCADMCIDMCRDMCRDMCTDMCTDMCIDMCTDMSIDMCIDICIDMCIDIQVPDTGRLVARWCGCMHTCANALGAHLHGDN